MSNWGSAITEAFKYFSPEARRDRVEGGLVSTLDGLVATLLKEKEKHGYYSEDEGINDYLDHYVRQYQANRKKLR
jgi:hypothetical protein